MLPGVSVREVKRIIDERGSFAEVFREDWKDLVGTDRVVQSNLSVSHPGTIRAWHRHSRGQVDYLLVMKGAVKVCVYDDEVGSATRGKLDEMAASDEKLQIIRIPGHYWHGTKTLGLQTSMILYLVTKLYDSVSPDEERRSWNDPKIIHPRTSKAYDWNLVPFK